MTGGVLEFRGTRRHGDAGPLVVGCGMAVTPTAVLAFAIVTGQLPQMLGDGLPRTPAQWLPHLGFLVAWAVGWSGAAGLLYLFNSTRLARRSTGFVARIERDGLAFTDRGRTWRSSWSALRIEHLPGDEETDSHLLFHGPSGTFDYPWMLSRVDEADFLSALLVKCPGAPVRALVYTSEIEGMLDALEGGLDDRAVEGVCAQILAKAERHAQGRYGMIPVLQGCTLALTRAGRHDAARPLADRLRELREELGQ